MRNVLLATALFAPLAHADEIGDWTIGRVPGESTVFAATLNDDSGVFGKYCTAETCRWLFTAKTTCDVGSEYPALLTSSAGSAHINLLCSPTKEMPGRFYIKEFDLIERGVSSGSTLAIAMPLDSGRFRVARFNVREWARAAGSLVLRMRELVRRPGEQTL